MVEGAKGSCIDDLPEILWFTRTTRKGGTCKTPFNVVYENKDVLPVEVGILSPRITFYDHNQNEKIK